MQLNKNKAVLICHAVKKGFKSPILAQFGASLNLQNTGIRRLLGISCNITYLLS